MIGTPKIKPQLSAHSELSLNGRRKRSHEGVRMKKNKIKKYGRSTPERRTIQVRAIDAMALHDWRPFYSNCSGWHHPPRDCQCPGWGKAHSVVFNQSGVGAHG